MTSTWCGTAAATAAAISANVAPAIRTSALRRPRSWSAPASPGASSAARRRRRSCHRHQQLDHLGCAAVQVSDPRSRTCTRRQKRLGEPVRALVEFRVGHRAVAMDDATASGRDAAFSRTTSATRSSSSNCTEVKSIRGRRPASRALTRSVARFEEAAYRLVHLGRFGRVQVARVSSSLSRQSGAVRPSDARSRPG